MSPSIELRILKSNLQQHSTCKTEMERLKEELEPHIKQIYKEWLQFRSSELGIGNGHHNFDIDDFELLDTKLSLEGEEGCMGSWEPCSVYIPRDFIFDRENAIERLKEQHEKDKVVSKLAAQAMIEKKKQDELEAEKQQYLKLKAKFEGEDNEND